MTTNANVRATTPAATATGCIKALVNIVLGVLIVQRCCAQEPLTVLTEFSPPFTVTQGNKVAGYATDPVRTIIERAGYQPQFKLLSWKAALDILQRTPEALIYPIARTPEREQQFDWIGRIGQIKYYVYSLRRRNIQMPNNLTDLQRYRVAAIRRDVRYEFLLAHGLSIGTEKGIVEVSDNVEAMQQLHAGRVDLAIFARVSFEQNCLKLKLDCTEFERLAPLGLSIELYLAGSTAAPAAEIKRLREAYKTLHDDGTLHRITAPAFESGE